MKSVFTPGRAWTGGAVLSLLAASLAGAPAAAHPVTGQIAGVFSNPVLAGSLLDGATGTPSFSDNTATAVYSGTGTNTFNWGTGAAVLNASTLTFLGNQVTSQPAGQNFSMGTIRFTNGTSDLNSLVFGVDLLLSVPSDPTVTPFTAHVNIVTTNNTGTNAQNADFIGFTVFPVTFNVFEFATASADLNGQFVGDPLIQLNGLTLQPGQDANGFIGTGLPVPAPGGLAVFGVALAVTALTRRRVRA